MRCITLLLVFTLLFKHVHASSLIPGEEQILDQQEIVTAVTGLIDAIDQQYLFETKRQRITTQLTQALSNGEFDGHFSFGRFKRKMEAMLVAVSHDSNFELQWRSGLTGDSSGDLLPGSVSWQKLPGDIGYISIEGDLVAKGWQKDIDRAFAASVDSRALIIDVRKAGLSSLALSHHVLSQFMPAGQPLSVITFARQSTEQMVSNGSPQAFPPALPIFIITSPFVAGPWEFVAYTLKHAERATIVGTPTMGVGYLTTTIVLSEHVKLVMANAELRHPKTDESWQGWGVLPTIYAEADRAMDVALKLAQPTQSK